MRRANNDVEVLYNDQDQLAGVNMGFDFTAEHEWGIARMQRDLGVQLKPTRDLNGYESRLITKNETVGYYEKDGVYYVASHLFNRYTEDEKKWKDYPLRINKDKDISIASHWDSNQFLLAHNSKELQDLLVNAFNSLNACVFIGAGLIILDYTKISEQDKQEATDLDMSKIRLKNAMLKTGIKERLKKADRGFHALSPRWANDEETEIVYWLNPRQQDLYNSAWVTEKDLDDWIAGKGKIIKPRKK